MSLGTESAPAPLSAADVAAVTGHNNGNYGGGFGMGGDWLIALVMLFLFPMFFGGGMWGGGMFGGMGGWGNGGMMAAANGALTRSDLCSEFNFNGLENSVRGIQQGICDSTFALNNSINGLGMNVMQGFHGVDNAICNLGYTMQGGFNATQVAMMQGQNAIQTQLADCCCKNQSGQQQIINAIDSNACATGRAIERGFCDTNYNQATNTTAIIQNSHNDTDRILAKLDAMEMSRKDEVIADLRTQLAQCGDRATADSVVARLTNVINPPAVPAYPAASPCGLGNWAPQVLANGWGGNCGCNSSCGNCGL